MSKAKRIVYQGEPGANSHLACRNAYPGYETVPRPPFEDAVGAVRSGEADLAMIPIENSVAGRVADVHHLLPRSGLSIIGEHFAPVHHHLLAVPGASIETLKTVRSHAHALSQCRDVIRQLKLTPVVAADTAGAAAEIARLGDPSVAAI